MSIKGRSRALVREGGRAGEWAGAQSHALSLSPSRTLVTPYCKRIHPGRRTTRGRGFPSLVFPPCAPSRVDPSGLGHTATIYSSVQGPPGVETPTPLYLSHNIVKTLLQLWEQIWNFYLSSPKCNICSQIHESMSCWVCYWLEVHTRSS
jgi:hypothetical protein